MVFLACLCLFVFRAAPGLSKDMTRPLMKAVQAGDEKTICDVLTQSDLTPTKNYTQLLLQLGVQTQSEVVFQAVLDVMYKCRGKDYYGIIQKALKHRNHDIAIMALFALSGNTDPEAVASIVPFLKSKHEDLRTQAARALGERPVKSAVTALVDMVAQADAVGGDFSAQVRRALYKLTGHVLPAAADWQKWWSQACKDWQPQGHLVGMGRTKVTGIKPPGKYPKFFGVEVFSLRVVFVIDISGSMADPAKYYKMSRLELVKRELIRTLKELPAKTHFNVVAFNSKIRAFSKDLVPATKANRTAAITMVGSFKAASTTWTQEALEEAFNYETANTIVLLSDGSPCKSEGRLPTKPIQDAIRRLNRFRKVTIHTIGFPDAYVPFLRNLALQNNGTFQNARPEKPAGR